MEKPELDTSLYKNFKGEGAPDDFHHVAWKTMQYDEMIDFYSRLFHCKPLYSSMMKIHAHKQPGAKRPQVY